MAFRTKLLAPHRWLGLCCAVLLLVQGCTGTVVAFRDELNRALHGAALTVVPTESPRPLQQLADLVRTKHPLLGLERIEYPKQADDAFIFRLQAVAGGQLRYVAVDPYRGTITRDEPLSGWPVQWIYQIHQRLLAGEVGHVVVGLGAIALLFFVITGPWMWWPGVKHLRRGLTPSFSHGPQRSVRDLHRIGGAVAAALLFCTATTGIALIWSTPLRNLVGMFATVALRPAPVVAKRDDISLLPLDHVIARARGQFGSAPIKSVRFPGLHGRVVSVYFVGANPRPRATDQVALNGYTGEPLGTYDSVRAPIASRTLDWALPIHSGEFLGLPGRLLFVFTAITLQMLVITGLLQWWQRRRPAAPP